MKTERAYHLGGRRRSVALSFRQRIRAAQLFGTSHCRKLSCRVVESFPYIFSLRLASFSSRQQSDRA